MTARCKTTKGAGGASAVKFNVVSVLRHLADAYPSIEQMLMEIIQNIVDAGASRAEIVLDLERRTLMVFDNGEGCSREQFAVVVGAIGQTQKGSLVLGRFKPLGYFGIGVASPMGGKCRQYYFTSAPKDKKGKTGWEGYTTHIFDDVIAGKRDDIPWVEAERFNQSLPWWNTHVQIKGLNPNRLAKSRRLNLSTILEDGGVRFGEALRDRSLASKRLEIKVTVKGKTGEVEVGVIEPLDFRGRKLDAVTLQSKEAGAIQFRLYACDKANKGRLLVQIGSSPYQVPWESMANQAAEYLLDEEIVRIVGSGHFEGLIIAEKCAWNLERTAFEESDRTLDFYAQIEQWAKKYGRPLLEGIKAQGRSTRYEQIGLRVVNYLMAMKEQGVDVLGVCLSNFVGSVSNGHVPIKGAKETTPARSQPGHSHEGPGQERGGGQPKGEHKDAIHLGVATERGTRRVASASQRGLTISYEEMPGSAARFEARPEEGTVAINYRHPDFAECEGSDVKLELYVRTLVRHALVRACMPEHIQEMTRTYDEVMLPLEVWEIIEGVAAERRVRRAIPIDH